MNSKGFRLAMAGICAVASGFWLGVGLYLDILMAQVIGLMFAAFAFGNLFFSGEGNEES